MSEYIEREAVYEKAYWHGEHPDVGNPFPDGVDAIDIKDVDAIPAADVAPVRHGRWIDAYPDIELNPMFMYGICSKCGFEQGISKYLKYCPDCGCRMDGVVGE